MVCLFGLLLVRVKVRNSVRVTYMAGIRDRIRVRTKTKTKTKTKHKRHRHIQRHRQRAKQREIKRQS